MRKFSYLGVALLLVLLAGCGGPSAAEKKAEKDRTVAAAAKKKQEARQKKIGETGALCKQMVQEFSDSLDDLNSRLSVGLKPDDYSGRLGDISVAYDKTDWDKTPNVYCVQKVGVPLEDAYKDFVSAGSTWSDCIASYNCDVEKDKLPGMQKKWAHAGTLIERSKAALEDFQLD
ncbi:MAG: hypothetical protein ABIR57_10280 [Aeromicrobium sp.]